MSMENEENGNKRRRERYVTCSEETLEEMEKYVDDKFDDKSKDMENRRSKRSQHLNSQSKGRGRPTIKTNKKQLLRQCYENQNKLYGFVQRVLPRCTPSKAKNHDITQFKDCNIEGADDEDKSPPAKTKKYGNRETDKDNSENENEANGVEGVEDEVLVDENNDKEVEDEENVAKEVEVFEDENFIDDDGDNIIERYASRKKCIDCEKIYQDKENDNGTRKCRICKCSEHGCLKGIRSVTSKGDMWMCRECLQLTNIVERVHPDLFENLRKTLMKKATKRKKTKNQQNKSLGCKVSGNMQYKKTMCPGKETEIVHNKKSVSSSTTLSLLDIVFFDEDVLSLNEGKWISDSIIAFWFKYLSEIVYKENQNILFIPPSVTQVLKAGFTDDFDMIWWPLNICQKKYIVMAVNDNKVNKSGGQHWSLLVYTAKENLWYHYDSLKNFNLEEARFLVGRLQEYIRPGATPRFTAASCTQQDNNYDCGAYTMIYAQKIAGILTREDHSLMAINPLAVVKEDTKRLRDKVRGWITSRTTDPKTMKKKLTFNSGSTNVILPRDFNGFEDDTLVDNHKSSLVQPPLPSKGLDTYNQFNGANINHPTATKLDLMNVKKYPNINKDKICPFLTRGKCRYGAKGENDLGQCNRYHPNQCREYNLNGTTENGCKKGNECMNWHATYICRLSANSNMCNRVN